MSRRLTKSLVSIFAVALTATAAGASLRAPAALPLALAAQGAVIPSDAEDALDRPELWDCTRILPEYRRWLEEGNAPESWKYVGKTYRDSATGGNYDWQDWLEWAAQRKCDVGPLVEEQFLPLAFTPLSGVIGGLISAAGAGGLLASGGNADSPG